MPYNKRFLSFPMMLYICIISCILLFIVFIPFLLVFKNYIHSNNTIVGFSVLILIVPCVLLFIAVLMTLIIAIVGIIKDGISHQYKSLFKYRLLTMIVPIASLFLILALWHLSPKIPREMEMQTIVINVHSGKYDNAHNYLMKYKCGGKTGHEDVYFYGYIGKQYLYTEDDLCDIDFGDGVITYTEHIKNNWYYIIVR